jgi:phosphoheptose isomerase
MEVLTDDSSSKTTMVDAVTMLVGSLLSRVVHAHGNNGQLVLTLSTAGRAEEIFKTVSQSSNLGGCMCVDGYFSFLFHF